jgi:hypothetical protein
MFDFVLIIFMRVIQVVKNYFLQLYLYAKIENNTVERAPYFCKLRRVIGCRYETCYICLTEIKDVFNVAKKSKRI